MEEEESVEMRFRHPHFILTLGLNPLPLGPYLGYSPRRPRFEFCRLHPSHQTEASLQILFVRLTVQLTPRALLLL